jgi:hypothetical protein
MRTLKHIGIGLSLMMLAWAFGCPSTPLTANMLGIAMHISAGQVSAASGLPTSVLWDYDFTQPLNKACSSSVTTNCVSGFQVGYFQSSGTQIGSWTSVALPATISSTGPTTGISTAYAGPTTLGSYLIEVQTMYKDSTGATQGGPVASLSFPLTPSAALNIRTQ